MNDFTKDELKMIDGWLPISTPERENHEVYQSTRIKLKSMIDNYEEECDTSWPSNMIKICPDCKRHHDE